MDLDDIEFYRTEPKRRANPEFKLHVAAVKHIESAFGCYLFHVPNQGGQAKRGHFLKMMGVKAGVSDLIIIWKGGIGFLELKAQGGHLTKLQEGFLHTMKSFGCKTGVAYSVQQVHDTLCKWGLAPRHSMVVEPDYRTQQQKNMDALELWKK